jgi:hypothetical protein
MSAAIKLPQLREQNSATCRRTLRTTTLRRTLLCALLFAPLCGRAGAQQTVDKTGTDFFEKSIRPLLAQRCYSCHNASSGVTRGGLALDTKEGWSIGGNHGAALVPGKPEKSLLLKAVSYADPNLQMPPGKPLSADQIALLKTWIQNGADDPRMPAGPGGKPKLSGLTQKARDHWAFQPIKKAAIPAVKNAAWVKTPIDAFVLAKLEAKGMRPAAPAAREALIRRAYYDLIGLPPTVDQVRVFLADRAPNAWAKVVDGLLASPHYGERWGRHWLDTARYADTRGYTNNNGKERFEGYKFPYAWTYRDYVIQSLNADKPYNQFLLEQIAADKLPDIQTNDPRLAALGFLTVGKRFQNPDDTLDERIDTVTKATLGLTVSCARCHDHKFDPIPTADYYSLHGIFASTTEPLNRPVVETVGDSTQHADYEQKLAEMASKNREVIYGILKADATQFQDHAEGYLMLSSVKGRGTERYDLAKKYGLWPEDRDIVNNLRPLPFDPVLGPFAALSRLPKEGFAERAAVLLPKLLNDPRRPVNPLVVAALKSAKIQSLEDVAHAYGDLYARLKPVREAFLQARSTPGAGDGNLMDPQTAALLETPVPVPPADTLATPDQQVDFFTDRALTPNRTVALYVDNRTGNDLLFDAMNELRMTHPGSPGCAMVVADSAKPRDSYIYLRGERAKRGPVVPRQFLEVLSGADRKPFTEGSGRLELAQAILAPTDPLPARVEVNRIWMYHFGEGFVSTPDDLGNQSETPSHPELLDWLAGWFMKNDWSMKRLHRLILLSSTYQESSAPNPAYALKDPANRLLWRANLRRLDFEAIRDSLVMLTGKLDESVGGKPVNITDEPYTYRRSCYGYVDRNNLSDLLTQFDFADPDMANTRRISTIVPQQALFFLNSPMSVDVARQVMARPEVANAPDDAAKVRAIYLILFQRSPKSEEVSWATEFLTQANSLVVAPPAKRPGPQRLPAQKPVVKKYQPGNRFAALRNEGVPVSRVPLTPWELYTQALLCSNEFVYVN